MHDPISGPLPREMLRELSAAPFGKAVETIRKHDPFWGRAEGEKIEWKVKCRREEEGVAYIKAADEKEANKLAAKLCVDDVDWGEADDFEILSVKPHIEKEKPLASQVNGDRTVGGNDGRTI